MPVTAVSVSGMQPMSFWKFVSWRQRMRVRQPIMAKISVKHVT